MAGAQRRLRTRCSRRRRDDCRLPLTTLVSVPAFGRGGSASGCGRREGLGMPSGYSRGMAVGGSGLVERDREVARLVVALGRARGGEGQVVAVRGAAGIGKTSLLRK